MSKSASRFVIIFSLSIILLLATSTLNRPGMAAVINETPSTSKFLTYSDTDLGFKIQYPSDWKADTHNLPANVLVIFRSPNDTSRVAVKFIPRQSDQTLKQFGDSLKTDKTFQISTYYRNSTTTLAGLPAIRTTGIYFNQLSQFQQALGYQSSTSKELMVWTLDPNKDGFFGIVYDTNKSDFANYFPIVDHMINSFEIGKVAQVIQG